MAAPSRSSPQLTDSTAAGDGGPQQLSSPQPTDSIADGECESAHEIAQAQVVIPFGTSEIVIVYSSDGAPHDAYPQPIGTLISSI